ncbi:MAG: hypothetical protein HC809_15815 [Gammaproteobacteria bacterium]|nr:hypothetical protein [Gammaproteobacteria bacterium]
MIAPSRLRALSFSIAMLLLGGCASTARPVLYPDGQQDMARVDADLLECRGRAEAAVGMNDAMTPKKRADVGRRGAMELSTKRSNGSSAARATYGRERAAPVRVQWRAP